jgi:hypothetical protein
MYIMLDTDPESFEVDLPWKVWEILLSKNSENAFFLKMVEEKN